MGGGWVENDNTRTLTRFCLLVFRASTKEEEAG